mmetsp:Transcript_5695/g.10794  ORF Transcript_5695/g.10794 Transcript_5695/m.10794 type:complete len:390 (+) Transcript_5695:170-1339(+)
MMNSSYSSILRMKPIPSAGPMPTPDPFLFCVYHKDEYPPGPIHKTMEAPYPGNGHDFDPDQPYRMYHGIRIPGFPQHPHRGFETITATIKGIIDHADSVGNAGRYGQGDVQWMTAGKGVVHGEMFPLVNIDEPNHTRFFQIWLNLPKKDKMVEPSFAMFWANDIPKYQSEDGKVKVTTWFGNYFLESDGTGKETGKKEGENEKVCIGKNNMNVPPPNSWASDPSNDVAVLHITILPGGFIVLPPSIVKGVNRSLYLVEGYDLEQGVFVAGKRIMGKVVLDMDPDQPVEISVPASLSTSSSSSPSSSDGKICEFLMLQGRPIEEPIAQHGPFVMNTWSEISQAFDDYYKTKFGGWPWPSDEMVFPQEKGRFALSNGIETFPTDPTTEPVE